MAAEGDTVWVPAGTHSVNETVVVDKSLVVIGRDEAVLVGKGDVEIIKVVSDGATIRNLTLRNVERSFVEDRAALHVDNVSDCQVLDIRIEESFFGIYLSRADNCLVANNHIVGSGPTETLSGNAIHAWYSRDLDVSNNYVTGHRDGIYFEFVEDSAVRGNSSEKNLRYGLHFMFSDRSSYTNNVFSDNEGGIAVMYSENVLIERNKFFNNRGPASYGLLLKEIDDSVISSNTFSGNSIGLYIEGTDRPQIVNNVFVRNGWGVKLMANCENVVITHNDFLQNSFDITTNSRNAKAELTGNYWDGYRGFDLDRNGVGDVPHRPVELFAVIAERNSLAVVALRSFFVRLLNTVERVVPTSTPKFLVDAHPSMSPISI